MQSVAAQYREIPEQAIGKFMRIRDDHPDGPTFAFFLEYLTFHMPTKRLDAALDWLLLNRLTGTKFLALCIIDCKGSGLELIRYLTMRLEREKKARRLHLKDVRV